MKNFGLTTMSRWSLAALGLALALCGALEAQEQPPAGFEPLFNGQDFTGWKLPAGDNGHWKIVDGVIDYDAQSEAKDDKNLWTEREFGDFVLLVDWKIKETPYLNPRVPIIRPDGSHKKNEKGEEIKILVPDSDSGIYLRGSSKAQVNIWCWPVGSGEVYGYRMDKKQPPEVRAGVTPRVLADNDIGQWNTFRITVQGENLTVELNGQVVLKEARLPGLPARGPLALQHHGSLRNGQWTGPPSLVQFRRIYIQELKTR